MHDRYPDALIGTVLHRTSTIALVGASANAARPSSLVLRYLVAHGFRVFPVNPGLAGGTIQGLTVQASLADVPAPVDMVDIFRNAEAAEIVSKRRWPRRRPGQSVWMQLGVIQRGGGAARPRRGPHRHHGPLSPKSSTAALRRNGLEQHQFLHPLGEASRPWRGQTL